MKQVILKAKRGVYLALPLVLTVLVLVENLAWAQKTDRSFEVQSNQQWQSTGLYVQNSEVVKLIYVNGEWRGVNGGAYRNPRDISPSPSNKKTADCFPVPEDVVGSGALLAKIGDAGQPVNAFTTPLVGEGMLYLRMNDCDVWLGDNEGSVTVRIKVIQYDRLPGE